MEPVKEVLEGTQVDFNCQAKGIPSPIVRWIFQNQAVSNTDDDTPDKGLGTGSILAIVFAILLLLVLLVVDVSCYYRCQRGFLMYCRNNILGRNSAGTGIESNRKMLSKSGKNTVVNVSGIEA